MNHLISVPTAEQMRALEKKVLKLEKGFTGDGLALFQESMGFLAERKRPALAAWEAFSQGDEKERVLVYKTSNLPYLVKGFERVLADRGGKNVGRPQGILKAKLITKELAKLDFGLISTNLVTNNGVAALVDILQGSVAATNVKYHGSGTGNTAEAAGDSALVTEVETRATGTNAEGASANIYRSVGTQSYTATRAIVEHGIFLASSTGTLFDRSVFSAINVINGDSIEWTYEVTFSAGG